MTFTNTRHRLPHTLRFSRTIQDIQLIIRGQGVFVFETSDSQSCGFCVGTESGTSGLTVEWSTSGVIVRREGVELKDPKNTSGLLTTPGASYWFSIDAQNRRLHAGVGEARKETAIYTYQLPQDSETKTWMESLTQIHITSTTLTPLRLLRDPITAHVPLHVKKTDELTMDDIAAATYMPSANLSAANQQLYNCISGKRFSLNTPDFPEFEEAIEYSIATPKCWCHETLKAKIGTFGEPKETYLRITLNQNNGESPGVPHVMEIWPVGHYSPVHNHGGANAVIRVLRGTIHVKLFAFLGGEVFGTADFKAGDITWISPTLNQVHQLKNLEGNSDTCITIQCYKYDADDTRHYDYFDYIDQQGAIQQFDPDSDMDFLAFKERMRTEWSQRPKGGAMRRMLGFMGCM